MSFHWHPNQGKGFNLSARDVTLQVKGFLGLSQRRFPHTSVDDSDSIQPPAPWLVFHFFFSHCELINWLTEEQQRPGLSTGRSSPLFQPVVTACGTAGDAVGCVFGIWCNPLPCELPFWFARETRRHEANGSSCAQLPAKLQLQMVSCYTRQTFFYTLFKTDTLHLTYICGEVFSCLDFLFFFFSNSKYHNWPCALATMVWPQCFSVNWENTHLTAAYLWAGNKQTTTKKNPNNSGHTWTVIVEIHLVTQGSSSSWDPSSSSSCQLLGFFLFKLDIIT